MFSLRTLFIAVVYAAIACSALIYRSPLWGSVVVTLTVCIGTAAGITAWVSPASRHVYGAFAIALWAYALIVFCPFFDKLERQLVTTHLIFQAWPKISAGPLAGPVTAAYWDEFFFLVPRNKLDNLNSWDGLTGLYGFYYSVHSIVAVLLGAGAGIVTTWGIKARDTDSRKDEL